MCAATKKCERWKNLLCLENFKKNIHRGNAQINKKKKNDVNMWVEFI